MGNRTRKGFLQTKGSGESTLAHVTRLSPERAVGVLDHDGSAVALPAGRDVLLYWNKVAPLASGMRARFDAPGLFENVEHLARALDERMTMLDEPHPVFIQP